MSTRRASRANRTDSIVVICTRNRPDDLARALQLSQECSPDIPMLVADASDGGRDLAVQNLVAIYPSAILLSCTPGLARQRNQALEYLRELPLPPGVVHFIDDDTEPLPGYFQEVEAAFAREPDLGGVGGVIVGEQVPRFGRLKRLFRLSSSSAGVVLPSGKSTMPYFEDWVPTAPQRLPGCAMSYRMSHIDGLTFDNRLEGYSYGEDVVFSYALSERHPLLVEPRARVRHHLSPVNRQSRFQVARDGILLRHRFVRENERRGLSVGAFWWSVASDVALRLVKGVVTLDPNSLATARGMAAGAWDVVRRPLPAHVAGR